MQPLFCVIEGFGAFAIKIEGRKKLNGRFLPLCVCQGLSRHRAERNIGRRSPERIGLTNAVVRFTLALGFNKRKEVVRCLIVKRRGAVWV